MFCLKHDDSEGTRSVAERSKITERRQLASDRDAETSGRKPLPVPTGGQKRKNAQKAGAPKVEGNAEEGRKSAAREPDVPKKSKHKDDVHHVSGSENGKGEREALRRSENALARKGKETRGSKSMPTTPGFHCLSGQNASSIILSLSSCQANHAQSGKVFSQAISERNRALTSGGTQSEQRGTMRGDLGAYAKRAEEALSRFSSSKVSDASVCPMLEAQARGESEGLREQKSGETDIGAVRIDASFLKEGAQACRSAAESKLSEARVLESMSALPCAEIEKMPFEALGTKEAARKGAKSPALSQIAGFTEEALTIFDAVPENAERARSCCATKEMYERALGERESFCASDAFERQTEACYEQANAAMASEMAALQSEAGVRLESLTLHYSRRISDLCSAAEEESEGAATDIEAKRRALGERYGSRSRKAKESFDSECRKKGSEQSEAPKDSENEEKDESWWEEARDGLISFVRKNFEAFVDELMSFGDGRMAIAIENIRRLLSESDTDVEALAKEAMAVLMLLREEGEKRFEKTLEEVKETGTRLWEDFNATYESLVAQTEMYFEALEQTATAFMPAPLYRLIVAACLINGIEPAPVFEALSCMGDVWQFFENDGSISEFLSTWACGIKDGFEHCVETFSVGKLVEAASAYLFSDIGFSVPAALVDDPGEESLKLLLLNVLKSLGGMVFEPIAEGLGAKADNTLVAETDREFNIGAKVERYELSDDLAGMFRSIFEEFDFKAALLSAVEIGVVELIANKLLPRIIACLTGAGTIAAVLSVLRDVIIFFHENKAMLGALAYGILHSAKYATQGAKDLLALTVSKLLMNVFPLILGLLDAALLGGKVKEIVSKPTKRLKMLVRNKVKSMTGMSSGTAGKASVDGSVKGTDATGSETSPDVGRGDRPTRSRRKAFEDSWQALRSEGVASMAKSVDEAKEEHEAQEEFDVRFD